MATKNILVVDDQEGIRSLLSEMCSLLGHEVVTAASGDEALQIVAIKNFDAALIDMKMPGLDGLETLDGLRSLDPQLKVFLMTGYGDVPQTGEALKRGICKIIHKPFDLADIMKCLTII